MTFKLLEDFFPLFLSKWKNIVTVDIPPSFKYTFILINIKGKLRNRLGNYQVKRQGLFREETMSSA